MNRAFLLGSLFLRVTSVYASATHGDIIAEGKRRNEEAYEQALDHTGWKLDRIPLEEKKEVSRSSKSEKPTPVKSL